MVGLVSLGNVGDCLWLEDSLVFEFEGGFEGGEGDFELAVVGFFGGEALEHEPGEGQKVYQAVLLVFGGETEEFVGDSGDEGEEKDADAEVGIKVGVSWNEGIDKNTEHEDDEDETGAAARVETGLFGGVFWGEFEAALVGKDGFVFSAVVLENTFEAWGETENANVGHKKYGFDAAVDEVVHEVVVFNDRRAFAEEVSNPEGEKFEEEEAEAEGKNNGKYKRCGGDDLFGFGDFWGSVGFGFGVDGFGWGFVELDCCRKVEHFHADDHHFKKVHDSSDKGNSKETEANSD